MLTKLLTQVDTFHNEFKLNAIAINSTRTGTLSETLKDIVNGKYEIVILSPEMLQTRRFVKEVLRNTKFTKRVLSVVIDEAHVVSHWGKGFRKKYAEIGMIRAFLPKDTPFAALSATLSPRIRDDVVSKLNMKNYLSLQVGNDRPNVSLAVRAIHSPMNTYADLDFIIPPTITSAQDIPKTFIYSDNITEGIDIQTHLISKLPVQLQDANVIRPYNAAFDSEYRRIVMSLFKSGETRVLVCTDAAGMVSISFSI
jgi:superfamily II DNA helicase RecQ